MSATFRLATFNVENLFARYRFRSNIDAGDGFTINDTAFDLHDDRAKRITGKAIRETKADIICVQEVENLPVLQRFDGEYLAPLRYKNRILIDGNDPRQIDVGVLSKENFPIVSMRSHRHERNETGTTWKFSRDCLVVDFDIAGRVFTVYVNHLKSMMDRGSPDGRRSTRARRLEQAQRVREIVETDFGDLSTGNFAIVGDFNDYPEDDADTGTSTALTPLLELVEQEVLINVNDHIPDHDMRWTHFWAGGGVYRQLDYIFLPRQLWEKSGKPVPEIVRSGLPYRAEKYTGERFEDVGQSRPKASDHCPLAIDIRVNALSQ